MVKDSGDLILVGRDKEMAQILSVLEKAEHGHPGMVLLMGEAGVGKTRLAREVLAKAATRGWRLMSGKCLHESMTPYMPVMEALREGKLEHLMEFSQPPRVEHVLFVCPDGRIYAKVSRSEGHLDTEIFAGMLMAVGAFVKDSLSGLVDTFSGGEGFNVMGYERFRIVAGSRPEGTLVLVLTGQETELLKDEMAETLDRIVRNYSMLFCGWDGSPKVMEPLNVELDRFIKSGKYDGIDEVTEPENRHWRLLTNVTRGIARATKEAPLLLFLDDLQWSDPSSLGLVRYLLKRLKNERLLILGTCRSEELGAEHPLIAMKKEIEADGRLVEVGIGALHRDDVVKLVEQEVGESLGRGALGGLIAIDSGGNPFLARELVALLREEEVLVKDAGQWRLTKTVEKLSVPRKVGETIIARLAGLSRDEREVLETGAIMGEVFKPKPVACVLKINPLQVHRALREIEKRYKLVRNLEDGKRYRFNHPLVREVIYEEVPQEMRGEYHRAAVDCLVREAGDGLGYLTEIAYHSTEGKHPDAVAHLQTAGDAARHEYHNVEAARFYQSALELAKDDERVTLMESLGETEYIMGRFDAAGAWFEKVRKAAADRNKRVMSAARLARVLDRKGTPQNALLVLEEDEPDNQTSSLAIARWRAARAWVRFKMCQYDGVKEDATEALKMFKVSRGTSDDIADCWNTLGALFLAKGEWAEAEINLRHGLAAVGARSEKYQMVRLMNNLGLLEEEIGHIKEALELFNEVVRISDKLGMEAPTASALAGVGRLLMLMGSIKEAHGTLTSAIEKCEKIGLRQWVSSTLLDRAFCLLEMGEMEQAERDIREALLGSQGTPRTHLAAMVALAELLISRGSPSKAIELMENAMDTLRKPDNRDNLNKALLILAHAYAIQNMFKEADNKFIEAFKIPAEAWYYAKGLRWWGEALTSRGEKDKAIEKLEEARKRFAEMGAALELRKTEEALSRLRNR